MSTVCLTKPIHLRFILIATFFAITTNFSSYSVELTSNQRLKDKVAIITGASKGIGKAITHVFAREGAKVVIVSRSVNDLDKLIQSIRDAGGEGEYFQADVSREDDVQKMVDFTVKRYGRIDIVIHNAGIYPKSRIDTMSTKEWHRVMATNLDSAFYIVKAVTPAMKRANHGRIVFTSSISGPRVGLPGVAHYTASKAGMNGFMKTAAIELAKYNITINAVEPGNIITEGYENVGQEQIDGMMRAVPLGRLGSPEDVAYAHLFLSSDEAQYITGQSIIVDGGQTLPESHFLEY